jgi:P-type Cu+ transporter
MSEPNEQCAKDEETCPIPTPRGKKVVTFGVTGMSCASCAQIMEGALTVLPGVSEVSVNLATEKARLVYDPKQLGPEAIQKAVERAGYGIAVSEVHLGIKGMVCASCVQVIEETLMDMDGVFSATVNLALERATVKYDPGSVTLTAIKGAVIEAGYDIIEAETIDTEMAERGKEQRRQLFLLIFSLSLSIPIFLLMVGFDFFDLGTTLGIMEWEGVVLFILATPVQFIAGYQFYIGTYKALRNRRANMDTLIALGSSAAYFYSTAVVFLPSLIPFHHTYFDTSALIISLILLGKYLEAKAKGRTSQAIRKLVDLQARTAHAVVDGQEVEVPVESLKVDDVFIVRPGEKIATDGVVQDGFSAVDESMLTGESIPVEKSNGSMAIGGSINKNGVIRIRATRVGKDTALSQIIRLVEDAQASKAPIQRYADRVSAWFVPAVISIAVVSFLFWFFIGYSTFEVTESEQFIFSLSIFIAVLVISCPCALGLATPTAIMVGSGKGAENGILFKSGGALETAGRVQTIVFDKTGTLTNGQPEVVDVKALGISESELLRLAAAAERGSEHPLGEAIVRKARKEGLELPEADLFEGVPGKGIRAELEGKAVVIGNRGLIASSGVAIAEIEPVLRSMEELGRTAMIVAVDGRVAGIIGVADVIKDSSVEALQALKAMKIDVIMITGDNQRVAKVIADSLGIGTFIAEVLPENKALEITRLQEGGKIVAMVGDGVNDAPALAQADVGIAIGSGTDVAMETGDIVLVKGDLRDVVAAIQLSRRTMRKNRQNLFWALGYNSAGIPIAAGILYPAFHILLNPIVAAAAMAFSSVSVVLNAALLKRYTPEIKRKEVKK